MNKINAHNTLCSLLLSLVVAPSCFGYDSSETKVDEEQTEYKVNQTDYSAWTVGLGSFSLDDKNAEAQGIGSSATFIKLGWEGQSGALVYGLGINGLLLSDKDSFSVVVESNFGDVSTAKSSAEAYGVYGELGYTYHFSDIGNLEILGGVDILSAERSISNCSDCPSENIDLDGGLYLEPRIRFFNDSGFIFSISYRKYFSDHIDGGAFLGFSWSS